MARGTTGSVLTRKMAPTKGSRHLSPSSSSSHVSELVEIGAHRGSSGSEGCLSDDVDLESGELEAKVHEKGRGRKMRGCRICHLGLEGISSASTDGNSYTCNNGGGGGYGVIELGCSCKGDLGSAHRKCAETWFKIKGNTICEICGTSAVNVAGEQTHEVQADTVAVSSMPAAPVILVENRTFWHSRRVMNFVLACMVLAFVISWLFHFKILS